MTARQAYFYGDPAKAAEIREEQQARYEAKRQAESCDGCIHKTEWLGQKFCERGRTRKETFDLRRCTAYKTVGEA